MMAHAKLSKLTLTFGITFTLISAFQNCGDMNANSLSSMMSSVQPTPQPSPQPGPVATVAIPDAGDVSGPGLYSRVETTTFDFQIMNKHHLASRLEFIFGEDILRIAPGVGVAQTIGFILQQNPIYFGSMCSAYETVWIRNSAGTLVTDNSPLLQCSSVTQATLPLQPPLGAVREAMVDKICARAVNTAGPVHFAIHKTDSRSTPLFLPSIDEEVVAVGPVVNSRNFALYSAFRLFYPTQPDPRVTAPNLLESYRSFFANPSRPQLAEWQVALYSLCISPYWRHL